MQLKLIINDECLIQFKKLISNTNMKVVSEITQCKLCYNLIQVPVLLVCCSESICQKHIDEIKSNNIESKFICSLCGHKHEHDIFPINKAIERLLSTHFDKINLGKDYQEAKQNCEKLKSLIRQLKDTIINPRNYIDEYVSNIKMKIDLRREETKKDVDDLCDRLMNDFDTFKNECYANIEPLMEKKDYMDQLNEIIQDFDVDVDVCLEDFEFFDVDKSTWEDYGGEAMDQIEKTTDVFRKLKNDLLLQKTCKLSKKMDINKFNKDFSDEFKIESRFDNVIKCEIKQFSNYTDLDFKNGKKRKKKEKIFTSELIKSGEFEFRADVYVDDESNLGAFLNCATDNNKSYPIMVDFKIKLINHKNNANSKVKEIEHEFNENGGYGSSRFVKISNIIDKKSGFYTHKEDTCNIEIAFCIINKEDL